jgi:phosphoglycolate phosphatase
MTAQVRLVALDIAGTTVQEGGVVYRVLAEVVAAHGTPATDADIRRWMGADKREALAALTEALHSEFVQHLQAAYTAQPPRPLDRVTEAFATLRHHGVAVALTTGFDRQVTDPLLEVIGWQVGRDVDAVVCAADVGIGRPAPDMIRRAMALTGVTDPAQVLTAGDTVLDVQAGHAAEASYVIAVLSGAQTRDELMSAAPTHVLDGVQDIPALLGFTDNHPDALAAPAAGSSEKESPNR